MFSEQPAVQLAGAPERGVENNIQVETFERAGSTIHYWTAGPPDAPAVILTHGVTLDHGTFAGQIAALSGAGYRTVAWDLRGHGSSQPMGQRFSIQAVVDDLALLFEAAGIERAVLVGQSYGGSVVQEFFRQHPQRAAALVLIGAMALGERPPWHQRVMMRIRPLILKLWPEGHLRKTIPAFMSQKPEVQRYAARVTQALSKADFIAVTEASLAGILEFDLMDGINVPVLVAHGDAEMALVVDLVNAWVQRDPHVQREIVPNAGHLANQDHPEAFNRILLDFLAKLDPF